MLVCPVRVYGARILATARLESTLTLIGDEGFDVHGLSLLPHDRIHLP
jgi:hypothetical protein